VAQGLLLQETDDAFMNVETMTAMNELKAPPQPGLAGSGSKWPIRFRHLG